MEKLKDLEIDLEGDDLAIQNILRNLFLIQPNRSYRYKEVDKDLAGLGVNVRVAQQSEINQDNSPHAAIIARCKCRGVVLFIISNQK